jgi:hypothetical protein
MTDLTALGLRLRGAGLTEGALLAWAGTRRLSSLPWRLSALAARPPIPAATALALFVAGAELGVEHAGLLPIEELVGAGLLVRTDDRLRATVAVIPLEAALLVCDRPDAPDTEQLVCWPDDSSHHLRSAIAPGRRERWIDLACGSAFAPLARPELGAEILGVDLNPRALWCARLGAGLSGVRHLAFVEADIGAAHPPAQLVTCNAPIAGDPDAAVWRRTDRAFFTRMWPAARACTAPGGEVIAHTTFDAVPAALAGEVVTVVYTPPGERAYAITWWRPDADPRRVVVERELTTSRPHLDPRDREDALAGALPPHDATAC